MAKNSIRKPFKRSDDMNSNQLERLRKDSRELGHYLAKLKKLGKTKLAHKMQKRQDYMESRICELEEEYLLQSA